ncbi:hypothetical protein AKJ51_01565 [candidate division MSBL1 archaeon SCGC-AAA382A20]|uniref:Uncharacterized protein n=1 Tax=candidate division MSBL1 archaeon SCGC-AAA382A20 TaxID=1698280 RepID=A0A133VLN0_9EURY|nr:hypothetical protein AKJ51_01565 [candidate division MSBL1 archaeon SCGC-AAA382A20]
MSAEAPGIETIFYAVKQIIAEKGYDENNKSQEFYLKATTFGKMMKGLSPHDKHNLLNRREITKFGNQLIKVALFWNSDKIYRSDIWNNGVMWQVQEVGESIAVKVKFTPRKVKN